MAQAAATAAAAAAATAQAQEDSCLQLSNASLSTLPILSDRRYKRLNASNNRIRVLWTEDFPDTVEVVNLEHNSIHVDGFPALWPDTIRWISLAHNPFRSLEGVASWPSRLRVLNLSNTALYGTLPTNLPDSIEDLDISHTDIVHVQALPAQLKRFRAKFTRMRTLPLALPEGVEQFEASESYILNGGLPRKWGSALRSLDLHGNCLREFPKRLPGTLRELNVSNNDIVKFCERRELPAGLEILHAGRNRILAVPGWFVRDFSRTLFTIQQNRLTEFPVGRNCISAIDQWVGPHFQLAAALIQAVWRRRAARRRLRAWLQTARLREELLAAAMHPDRAGRFEDISPAWTRSVLHPF